ncbi:MAG TPA: hypothetical protein VF511_08680 [Chthoniobacterales bacterium]|jgi:hypothetical protein
MKHSLYCIAMVALIAFVYPMATAETTPTPGASGIEGIIMVSPSRPGPIHKGEGPTARPARNLEFVVKKGDARIASFTTNAEGGFRVSLPPGQYTVLREDPGARIGHWRFEAEVKAGEMTKVHWTGDSGMR